MHIRHLLKSQSNQLIEEIKSAGWNPSEFKWEDTSSLNYEDELVSQLIHSQSDYYFVFDNVYGQFLSIWSPANQTQQGMANSVEWRFQLDYFKAWLSYLRREVESPDLWSAISQETELVEAASSDESNTPFNAQEKDYILSGINEIKQYLLTAHKLDPQLVESRLKYLAEASDRVGRKDWINLLLSVLVGIVVQAALPPESIRELFRFVGTVLSQILKHQLLLP